MVRGFSDGFEFRRIAPSGEVTFIGELPPYLEEELGILYIAREVGRLLVKFICRFMVGRLPVVCYLCFCPLFTVLSALLPPFYKEGRDAYFGKTKVI